MVREEEKVGEFRLYGIYFDHSSFSTSFLFPLGVLDMKENVFDDDAVLLLTHPPTGTCGTRRRLYSSGHTVRAESVGRLGMSRWFRVTFPVRSPNGKGRGC